MCAYNAVNDQPACANDDLLTARLRKDWGFDGESAGFRDELMQLVQKSTTQQILRSMEAPADVMAQLERDPSKPDADGSATKSNPASSAGSHVSDHSETGSWSKDNQEIEDWDSDEEKVEADPD